MDSEILNASSSFVVFSGTISNLQVIASESNLFVNEENRRLGALATLGLATIGESGSAATSLQHASGEDIKLQLFRCEIDGKTVYGCFSRVFFANGENVDIVAEPQDDGGFYAYSVRRPIDHRLWLPLYCERGTKAHRKANMIMATWFSAITIFLGFIIIIYKMISGDRSIDFILKVVGVFSVSSMIWFCFLFFVFCLL